MDTKQDTASLISTPGSEREPLTPVAPPIGPEPDHFSAELAAIFRSGSSRPRHRVRSAAISVGSALILAGIALCVVSTIAVLTA